MPVDIGYTETMQHLCVVERLGLIAYEAAWQMQDAWASQVADGQRLPTLMLLEHPHTYTFGRAGHVENLLWTPQELVEHSVQVLWVDRGGDVTYHGPGQLVGYPLLPVVPGGLRQAAPDGSVRIPQADYVGYLRRLENVLIRALSRLGVTARQIPGLTGVWVERPIDHAPAKIAAIGVKIDVRGVSRHGFALNVNPDMTYWHGIIGCGLTDAVVTSLAELLSPVPDMETVTTAVIEAFMTIFNYQESRPGETPV